MHNSTPADVFLVFSLNASVYDLEFYRVHTAKSYSNRICPAFDTEEECSCIEHWGGAFSVEPVLVIDRAHGFVLCRSRAYSGDKCEHFWRRCIGHLLETSQNVWVPKLLIACFACEMSYLRSSEDAHLESLWGILSLSWIWDYSLRLLRFMKKRKTFSYSPPTTAVNKEVSSPLWVPGCLGHKMDINDLDFLFCSNNFWKNWCLQIS